jgi:hypothetical protein
MTASSVTTVLERTRSLAAERGWAGVSDFLSGLPAESDDSVLVLPAEGVRAEPLADWIAAAVRDVQVRTGPLEPVRDNPAAALAANRVVTVFQCGRLLNVEGVDAATEILSRPAASYAIVFVGAEAIRDLDELDLIERGIWQALVGEPGVRWGGQDLAERRCLLWSQAEAADAVAGRIARDRRLLEEWLQSPIAPSEALAGHRAAYALLLAERESAAAAAEVRADDPSARAARLRAVRDSVESLHRRLLYRLDDDAGLVERQITSSLELLQQDLLRKIRIRLEQKGNRLWRDGDVRQDVYAVIRAGIDGWRAETAAAMLRRAQQTGNETSELLDGVDWDLVNDVSAARGGASYPDIILQRIGASAEVALTIDEPMAGPDLPAPGAPGGWAPKLRIVACGAALAAVAAVFTPLSVVPVVAVGAMGAVGGGLVNRYADAASGRRAAMAYSQTAVSQAISSVLATVREQLREATMPVRRAVAADFRAIEDMLHTAALQEVAPAATMPGRQPPAEGERTEDTSDEVQLAALRQLLIHARAEPPGAATDGEQE